MNEIVNTLLEWFGWQSNMQTVADLINNLVRLGVGSCLLVFLLNYPAKFIGKRRFF